ncbi:MAG: NAD(P)H:quinone oxidoreductase [Bryobacteraceae bacterium]|jgi:NAD(P)H dehydrogenase (quinone)
MPDVNVLVAFYSRGGNTESLANALAEGARSAGAEVRLRRARDIVARETMERAPGWVENSERMHSAYEAPTAADAEWADGIAFGTPTRFGNCAAELKAYIDSLGGAWSKGKLNGKAGTAFTSTSSPHGGNETTLVSLYLPMAHLGLIIVPLGYADPLVFRTGTPYGASAVTGGGGKVPPTEDDLTVARWQGRRLAGVARALKTLR